VGQFGQPAVAAAGGAAQDGEGLIDGQAEAFGENAFGLLDQDSGVQRGL